MNNDDYNNFSTDDAEKIGEGIGAVGAILGGIAAVVIGVVGLIRLVSGGDSDGE